MSSQSTYTSKKIDNGVEFSIQPARTPWSLIVVLALSSMFMLWAVGYHVVGPILVSIVGDIFVNILGVSFGYFMYFLCYILGIAVVAYLLWLWPCRGVQRDAALRKPAKLRITPQSISVSGGVANLHYDTNEISDLIVENSRMKGSSGHVAVPMTTILAGGTGAAGVALYGATALASAGAQLVTTASFAIGENWTNRCWQLRVRLKNHAESELLVHGLMGETARNLLDDVVGVLIAHR